MAKREPKGEADFGLTLEDLFATTLQFKMQVAGKPLTVEWAPTRYTPAVEERVLASASDGESDEEQDLESEIEAIQAATDDASVAKRLTLEAKLNAMRRERIRGNQAAIRDVLCTVLESWSLTTKGVMVPIDDEHLKNMPPSFLELVFDALWENAGPKGETESLPAGQS